MTTHYEYDRDELERDVRDRLTPREVSRLVQHLQGAVSAIDLLRAKAPHALDRLFGHFQRKQYS